MAKNKNKKFITPGVIVVAALLGFVWFQGLGENSGITPDAAATETVTEVDAPQVETAAEEPVEITTPEAPENSITIAGRTLTVKDWVEDSAYPYDREAQFGKGWWDEDGNGCDTRNDLLFAYASEATPVTFRDGKFCKVDTAVITDPYTGLDMNFQFGQTTSALTQIDHVIPLKVVWYAVAHEWTQEQRRSFSQDVINLVPSDGTLNNWKNASDAEVIINDQQFLSPEGKCLYIDKYTATAEKYDIPVSAIAAGNMSVHWESFCV